ncbi:VQ motif-containing protein 20-like [Diospyros lotus]|uniref:VQ motif-containing protein 20-like n=1 Tax=Diospyros lotus TaxID=55363 RepID=UPI0022522200|nr:VQ motif-containing protein 20-like [Diospyros lotus]
MPCSRSSSSSFDNVERGVLRGPRPPALMVNKSSANSTKQPAVKRSRHAPVIVYLRSPTVIHVSPEEFMGLVQRLTGKTHQGPTHAALSSSSSSSAFRHGRP